MEQLQMLWFDPSMPPSDPPEGFAIRTHLEGDDSGWCEACEELNNGLVSVEHFQKHMIGDPACAPDRIFYIYRVSDGKIAGTAAAHIPEGGMPSLHMVGVSNAFRGMGLSRPVCHAVMSWFRDHGFKEVMLRTDDFRLPAIRTYLKLGFRPWLYTDDMAGRWKTIYEKLGFEDGRYGAYDGLKAPVELMD